MTPRNVAFIAVALHLIVPGIATAKHPDGMEQKLAELESTYHVRIHSALDPATSFPATWRAPSQRMNTAPIHKQDIHLLLPSLERFLSTHPQPVLAENLEHIYLLGKLSFRERDYGGTHAGKSMYVVWDRKRKNSPQFVLERLHSEFSSILRSHHAFPNDQWKKINPDGFSYTGSGFEMLGKESIYSSHHPDQENGFLVKYSMSSLENDFNMISAWLFARSEELDALTLQYGRIQQKRILAEEFYCSLSDQYSFSQPHPALSP